MTRVRQDEKQAFYREVPVDDVGLAFRRFFATNFRHRCPACSKAPVTSGPFGVRDGCPHCGSRFKRLEGNELISISLSFFFASALTFLVALALVLRFGFFEGITLLVVAVGVVWVVLLLRPMRVLALWLLWLIGFVYPDRVPQGVSFSESEQAPRREGCPRRS